MIRSAVFVLSCQGRSVSKASTNVTSLPFYIDKSVSSLRRRYFSSSPACYTNGETEFREIKNVTVIGGGLMGSGIAQVCAQNNFNVTVVDDGDDRLQKCMVAIRKALDRKTRKIFPEEAKGATKFINDTLSHIRTSQNIAKGVEKADLVIEAVIENLELKQSIFEKAAQSAPKDAIFVSNTSSLAIKDIASTTDRDGLFGGLHFFTPVPAMALVEVIKIPSTSDLTFRTLIQFSKDLGKIPVACKDTPGFIVNRLLIPYMMEAVRFVERGDGTMEDVDLAMKLGAGYPMGPFELLDHVGLDTTKLIMDGWRKKFPGDPRFEESAILNALVKSGKYGVKNGEGFYKVKQ